MLIVRENDTTALGGRMIEGTERELVIQESVYTRQPEPEREFPSLFEPAHGSAPDIYGKKVANPIAMIWSGAMLLDFFGHRDAHDAIVAAIEAVLADPAAPRTADLGGSASTSDVGRAVAARISERQ